MTAHARRFLTALLVCAATACASSAPQWTGAGADRDAAAPEPALIYDPPAELPAPEAVRATSGQYLSLIHI